MAQNKRTLSPLALVLVLSGAFFLIFLIISGVFFLNQSQINHRSSHLFSGGAVGIVEINGVILDSKKTLARLERFEEDASIKAVVLRLNSPGGAVAPSQEIYEAVRNYRKPLVVSMGSVAASGAFYVACGAKKVFANPGTLTGSIGVIMEFANLQKLYQWAKIDRYSVKTGKFKDIGAEYRSMTDEERSLLQGVIGDVLQQFKEAISKGRNISIGEVSRIADGRIFSGAQAKSLHLIDTLGTIQDAIKEAAKLGKIRGKPNLIYGEKKKGLFEILFEDSSGGEESHSLIRGWLQWFGQNLHGLNPMIEMMESSGSSPDRLPGAYFLWNGARVE